MAAALVDELNATFLEVDQLAAQWKQTRTYERTLLRLRYLTPILGMLKENVRRMRMTLPSETWSQVERAIISERPVEFETIGEALLANDESFLRVVCYVGFVLGALKALEEVGTVALPWLPAE